MVQVVVIETSKHDLPEEVHTRASAAWEGEMDLIEGLIKRQGPNE